MNKTTEALKLALETAEAIVAANWKTREELATPEEFERWAKSRANHMVAAIREVLADHSGDANAMVMDWSKVKPEAINSDPMYQMGYAAAKAEPVKQEPVAWRDHVEHRLLTWRQSFVNRSGDQLALDDFMDQRSLEDLIDFVCDEYTAPTPRKHEPVEPEQEPVALGYLDVGEGGYLDIGTDLTDDQIRERLSVGKHNLYAAPVDAKAIRAEALEEAAKVCDFENHQLTGMRMDNEAWAAKNCAAAIRGLK